VSPFIIVNNLNIFDAEQCRHNYTRHEAELSQSDLAVLLVVNERGRSAWWTC